MSEVIIFIQLIVTGWKERERFSRYDEFAKVCWPNYYLGGTWEKCIFKAFKMVGFFLLLLCVFCFPLIGASKPLQFIMSEPSRKSKPWTITYKMGNAYSAEICKNGLRKTSYLLYVLTASCLNSYLICFLIGLPTDFEMWISAQAYSYLLRCKPHCVQWNLCSSEGIKLHPLPSWQDFWLPHLQN